MNDARLYVAESRINEEENRRLKENSWLVDVIRKLVYALDQWGIMSEEIIQ